MKAPKIKSYRSFIIYFFVALFLRLPFFFRDAIDHDESTFILVGQHLANGHLPYYELWDLKPPGVFYYFAGILWLFGKQLWLIRFSGVLLVAFSAWYVQKIGFKFLSKRGAFYGGLLTVYLFSVFGSVQGVLSEHISILPFLIGFLYLLKPISYKNSIIIGICFGLSFICRLNMAYPMVIVVAVAYLYDKDFLSLKKFTLYFTMTVTSLIIIFISSLPYIIIGDLQYLYTTVIEASLAYANVSFTEMLSTLPSITIFLTLTIIFSLIVVQRKELSKPYFLLISVLLGLTFMLFKCGKINGHYLIQIYPFLAVIFVYILEKAFTSKLKNVHHWIFVFFILSAAESYLQYYKLIDHRISKGTWYMGDGFEIVNWLEKNDPKEKNLLFMKHHLGYWLTETLPPRPVLTHPSNIYRDTAIPYIKNAKNTKNEELDHIFNQIKPKYIIEKKDYLKKNNNTNDILYQRYNNYTITFITENGVVLKRK